MIRVHPRKIGWLGTTALAMGGSNQSLFIISALLIGQGAIPGQGSAAIPLLIVGLLLALAAAPGWLELVLMSPNRVGGISAACTEAFKPYSQILSALTGVCYWWGWIPTCGVTAIMSAMVIQQWYLPQVPVGVIDLVIILLFTSINLMGIKWVTTLALPIASVSAVLAFLSSFIPILSGKVNWTQAMDFHLTLPFSGWFGELTALMAGLYLIGFAAPAFEAALCHVGETQNPNKNVPRAMWASAGMAVIYFALLPLVWHGTIGSAAMSGDLALTLGPTFAPIFGSLAKAMAIWFIVFNMFHGVMQPLAGASRTLSQLSEDGLAPRFFDKRLPNDVPWVATLTTASFALIGIMMGDPLWLIAAANFTYLIGICMPSVAVWLLRRDQPNALRPYRAPRGMILAGLGAAVVWGVSTILGFEQFGLPTVVIGLAMAYSGAAVFAWRKYEDRRLQGLRGFTPTLHIQLTGAMLLVLALDGAGYMLAISQIQQDQSALVTVLSDIFVFVAILTITVGIVLPGMIANTAEKISEASRKLAQGTLTNFVDAVFRLGQGDVERSFNLNHTAPIQVKQRDELGIMADNFNLMQDEIEHAAIGLEDARLNLKELQCSLLNANSALQIKVVEQAIITKELAIAATAFESQEGLIITDENRKILKVNKAFTHITGFFPSEVLGKTPDFNRKDLHDVAFYQAIWASVYSYRSWRGEIMNRHQNGHVYSEALTISAVSDAYDNIINYVYSFTDNTERKTSEAEIYNLAYYDTLTKLPNTRLLIERLNQTLIAGLRHSNHSAVLFIDLDHFKTLNDTRGYDFGNLLLVEVAKRLHETVRETDSVGRLSGDEFIVILQNLNEDLALASSDVESVCRKIAAAINQTYSINAVEFNISPSIGISLFKEKSLTSNEIIKRAESAMYLAKKSGRNTARFFDPAVQSALEYRLQLQDWMREAIKEGQFFLLYQLQVDADNKATGAEVLIRWKHPEKGMIFPDQFIPLAEETGMIIPIGLWVLRTACAQLKAWESDPAKSALQLAVNVSARQFSEADFVEKVQQTITESGIRADRLKLEITESLVLTDTNGVIEIIKAIKAMGVSFSMDDFGTGQSSLAYLTKLPIDQLKVDQSFVRNLQIEASAIVVRTIIGMANNLGLNVIAEGVETLEQRDFLLENGCRHYQGYYFSRPIPIDQFEALIDSNYKPEH